MTPQELSGLTLMENVPVRLTTGTKKVMIGDLILKGAVVEVLLIESEDDVPYMPGRGDVLPVKAVTLGIPVSKTVTLVRTIDQKNLKKTLENFELMK